MWFEYIPNRYPVNSGRFHGNRRDLGLGQPLRQLSQLLRHGPKDAFLLAAGSVFFLADQTCGDGLFVYVQAATIAMHSHGDPPLPLTKTPALEESPLRTLRMELSLCGSYGVRLNLICGFNEPRHCHYPSLIAQWRIPLCARSPLFSCFVVTGVRSCCLITTPIAKQRARWQEFLCYCSFAYS